MPSNNQPEDPAPTMSGAKTSDDRPTLREAFSDGLKADFRRDLEKLDGRAGGALVEARAAAGQAREQEAKMPQLGERIAAAMLGDKSVLLERVLRTNAAADAVMSLEAIRSSVHQGLKAVEQKAPTVGERLAFPTLLHIEINARRSAADQAQRPPGLISPTIKALQHRFEPKEVARREAEKIASPRFGEDEQQRRARIGAFLHGIAAYQIKSPVHSALGAHLVANLDGTPVPPMRLVVERVASAAWDATRGAGLALQRALLPEAWVKGQTQEALRQIPGEERSKRFERLGDLMREGFGDNPTARDTPAIEVGRNIHAALQKEATPHILTRESLLDLTEKLETSWTSEKQADYDKKLENHVAAAVAMWGYDPVDVDSTLHQREHEAAAKEWKAMTPVDRLNVRQAYDLDNGLTEHDLRFAAFAQTYRGEGAKAFDREWAAGLNDSQRSEAIAATADSIKHEGEKARRGEGWDANQHAALRHQLALLAEGRMSDRDLAALRDQETALLEKRDEAGLTQSEQAKLDELTRRTTLAAVANMALFQVGHGLDTAKAEAHAKNRADIDRIMNDGEHVELDEGTPEWGRAWEGLREHLQATGMGDGTEVLQPSYSQRTWQWMGSAELDGQIAHTFRHGDHPNTGRAEFVSVRDGSARDLADDRSATLEVANSH